MPGSTGGAADRVGRSATGAGPGGAHALIKGHTFQLREGRRDCAGVFLNYSQDITLRQIDFFFMHGMGVVAQFCRDVTLDAVLIAPDPAGGRTCAAWADCFHASGCRGMITVRNCLFDGAQDDAINIHGTHLQVAGAVQARGTRGLTMAGNTIQLASACDAGRVFVIDACADIAIGLNPLAGQTARP